MLLAIELHKIVPYKVFNISLIKNVVVYFIDFAGYLCYHLFAGGKFSDFKWLIKGWA